LRTANPTLNEKVFSSLAAPRFAGDVMSIQGTANKTAILLALAVLSAGWTWNLYASSGDPAAVGPWLLVGGIGGFVAALVTIFKMPWAPVTAPIYALLEGLVLGGISAMFEASYHGIAFQAIGLTFGTLAALLLAYKSGLIRATPTFRKVILAATGGIGIVYLASIALGFFGVTIPGIFGNGGIGLLFSGVVVTVAALNLVLDFDLIERGAAQGAPKYMEWYGAFALMVTLVWLYLEIIRLLSKLRSRD
jgi:uncharacterized YccA/Bax inhibitor family protein